MANAGLSQFEERFRGRSGPISLLIDCRQMSGYDVEARSAFVAWNKRWRSRLHRVAILTENRLWHVLVSAMALASGQEMRAFFGRSDAERWLR